MKIENEPNSRVRTVQCVEASIHFFDMQKERDNRFTLLMYEDGQKWTLRAEFSNAGLK